MKFLRKHPILNIPEKRKLTFRFNDQILTGFEGMVISSALFMNDIKIFGHHEKDDAPQGLFCANGQCSQCTVIVDGFPKKGCMTLLKEGMRIESCEGLPELPAMDAPVNVGNSPIIETEILVIGAGPAGLSVPARAGGPAGLYASGRLR